MKLTRLSAAAFGKLLVPDDAIEKLMAEVEAVPDKTAEESGVEALAWLEKNLSWVRMVVDLAYPQPPMDGKAPKILEEARTILLSCSKRRGFGRSFYGSKP